MTEESRPTASTTENSLQKPCAPLGRPALAPKGIERPQRTTRIESECESSPALDNTRIQSTELPQHWTILEFKRIDLPQRPQRINTRSIRSKIHLQPGLKASRTTFEITDAQRAGTGLQRTLGSTFTRDRFIRVLRSVHLVCSAASIHQISPQTTRTPQRTIDRHSTSIETFGRPTNPMRSELHKISTRKHTTPALASTKPLRSSSLSCQTVANRPPQLAPRKIRQPLVVRHELQKALQSPPPPTSTNSRNSPLAYPGRHKLPPHPMTSKKRQSLVERYELQQARQTASPINKQGQPPKPLAL